MGVKETSLKRFTVVASVLALVLATAAPAFAADGYTPREVPRRVFGNVDLGAFDSLDAIVPAFIQFDEAPVAELVASTNGKASAAQQRSQAQKVKNQQKRLKAQIKGDQIYDLSVGANGIAVRATVRDLVEAAELPEVLSVTRLPLHHIDNATSVPWIGTPQVWEDLGYTGAGITIGIIDTGIDYLHADFGGPGTPEAFAANDPTTLADGGFTVKVAGGYDFVGDAYDASTPGLDVPAPDPDPLDCNGHGTHVAGSAAGQGVNADGSTFTGPYDSTTSSVEFEVGPGVAPEATLYALKVFGCDGSTDITVEAIEWALDPNGDGSIDDHLDVINMSLGSDFGQPNDPTAIAADNAMAVGMLVVSAAGNDGPVPYVEGSPSVSANGVAVAASIDGGVVADGIIVNSPEAIAGEYEAAEAGITPSLDDVGPITGDLVVGAPLDGCVPLTNATEVAGHIALIQRGTCNFSVKILNAQAAGAAGVVVFNNVDGPPIVMGGDATGIVIPAVMISLGDGQTIHDTITGGSSVNVTLDGSLEFPKPELADTLADFTSSGPRGGDLFGPDLAAPGFSIDSAGVGTGFEGQLNSGTSMATPHMAGVSALMRQAHPGVDTDAIKSMMMNTTVAPNGPYPTTLVGTGIVRVDRALAADAYTSPAGVSFGRLNPSESQTYTQTVTVSDNSGEARTYTISDGAIQTVPGVTVSVPGSVSVPANGSATFDITMSLDPSAMPMDDGFYSQTEVDGVLTLASGEKSLRVGYLAVVDPASRISILKTKPGQQNRLAFENDGDSAGFVDTFTQTSKGRGTLEGVGVRSLDEGVLEFGVASRRPWDARSRREVDIYLDTDQDGTFEYVLVAADLGYLQGAGADGTVVTALFDLVNGGGLLEYYVIADFNDQTQILPVDLRGDFGFLSDTDTTFSYLAIDFDFDVPTGTSAGRVNLKRDVDKVNNLSGVLEAGASAAIDLKNSSRAQLLVLFQNNEERHQAQSVLLKTTGSSHDRSRAAQ